MNILIIWAWEWLWKKLSSEISTYDTIYTLSRKMWSSHEWPIHITGNVTKDLDLSVIDKKSLDVVVYIPSLWWTNSEMNTEEFDEYMRVWPRGLLNCFHSLKDGNYCNNDCLFVSIGSTASETALGLWENPSSSIYSLSKLTQKSTLLQLAHTYKEYRYLNITLGSIGTEEDGWVGYDNICNTIKYTAQLNRWVRYTEVALVSSLDM